MCSWIVRFPYWGDFRGTARCGKAARRTNRRNQPPGGNGEGVAKPLPYPLMSEGTACIPTTQRCRVFAAGLVFEPLLAIA